MDQPVITSKLWQLNWKDVLRGLLLAVLTAPLTTIYTSIESGNFHFDWPAIVKVSVTAGLAYLFKNLATPATLQKTISNSEVDAIKAETKIDTTAK